MRSGSRGFTLIELAVVLAIIAVLAAILTPLVTQYVDEARTTRALSETKTIATAILLHQRDTGKFPIFATYTAATTDADVLFGPGTGVTFSGAGWGSPTSVSLQSRLNTNFFSLPTTYGGGRVAYHGPYTAGIDSDPWGRTYVAELGPAPGNSFSAFVVSAGPNGVVETTKLQTPASFALAGDDIATRIK